MEPPNFSLPRTTGAAVEFRTALTKPQVPIIDVPLIDSAHTLVQSCCRECGVPLFYTPCIDRSIKNTSGTLGSALPIYRP